MTSTTREEQAAIVDGMIKKISHIATLPQVTMKIIEVVEDPSSTAQDLHQIISNDQALCSRILKVVNSAFYGLPRQIGSINRAIVLLGLNAVKNIAIAASLSKLFRGGDICPQFSAKDLWVHSIATATISKMLCDELRLGLPDEAFLAGLIHDIGLMVELQAERETFAKIFEELAFDGDGVPQEDMCEIEEKLFGANHQAFGAGLCDAWKFPKSFTFVTGHHHDPLSLPAPSRTLVAVITVADRMAAELGFGFRGDLQHTDVTDDLREELGVSIEALDIIKAAIPEAVEEIESSFSGGG